MPEDRDRRDDQHEQVVGVEHQRVDAEGEVERRVEALRPHLLAEGSRAGTARRTRAAGVSPSVATVRTRRGARKKRRMISSSHAAPSATAAANPAPNATQPRKARGDDDHHRQGGRDVAEVGLREVEDPVGAVHERHAHADHRGEQADEHAAQRDAGGDRERDHLEEQDQGGGQRGSGPTRRARSSKGPPPSAPNPSLDIGSSVPPVCGGT